MLCVKRAPCIMCRKSLKVCAACTNRLALHGMLESSPQNSRLHACRLWSTSQAGIMPSATLKRSCGHTVRLTGLVPAAHAGDPVTRRCHSCDTLVSSQAFHRKDAFTSFVVGESVLGWPKAYAALKEAWTFQPVNFMTKRRLSHLTLSTQHRVTTTRPINSAEM